MGVSGNRDLIEWIRPWCCGLGSGVVDITVTFPINKVMFRQQLNGITSRQAIKQLKCKSKGLVKLIMSIFEHKIFRALRAL